MIKCNLCHLYKTSIAGKYSAVKINGSGNRKSKILLVGEIPGTVEVRQKKYFMGEPGELVRKYLKSIGIDDSNAFFSSVVRCRAPQSRKPTKVEVKKCLPYLEEEIDEINPRVIGAFGNVVTYALGIGGKITSIHGSPIWSKRYNCWVLPLYHPAYVLRFTNEARQRKEFVEDLGKLNKLVKDMPDKEKTNYKIIKTIDGAKKATEYLIKQKWFSFDIETTNLSPFKSKILCVSFSTKPNTAIVIPYQLSEIFNEKQQKIIHKLLVKILTSKSLKIAQNGKFDIKHLMYNKISVKNFAFDTMLAHYLLDESGDHHLSTLALVYTDMGQYKNEVRDYIKGKIKIGDRKSTILDCPLDKLFVYSAKDADVTLRIKLILERLLKEEKLEKLFYKIVVPTAVVLAHMELAGILVDKKYIDKIVVKFKYKIKELERDLQEDKYVQKYLRQKETGEFNFRSSKQLRELLFDTIGLRPVRYNKPTLRNLKGNPSTDADSLEMLSRDNKIILLENMMQYRKIKKFQDYILEYQKLEEESTDGRIHTDYVQSRTVTGRLASNKPNLQNIPSVKKEPKLAKLVRNCFVASPGYTLVEPDYGQMEFRIWAHCSKDNQLIEYINMKDDKGNPSDIHKRIASKVYRISEDKVTGHQRAIAKGTVYGIIYGRGNYSIAQEFKMIEREVERVVRGVFNEFPKAVDWIENNIRRAKDKGYVRNLFGRKRRSSDIYSTDKKKREAAERQVKNAPIQSGAADIVYLSMIKLFKEFRDSKVRLLLNVHDSLVFEVPDKELKEICKKIKDIMENVIKLRTPLTVDLSIGKKLGEMEKYL